MMSALVVFFGMFSSAHLAAAQSSPVPSQASQQSAESVVPAPKPLLLPPATHVVLRPSQIGSANDRGITTEELRSWMAQQSQKDGLALKLQWFGNGPDAPNCAHIQIIQAPEMDAEMVVQVSPNDGGPIQIFQGLPPCRRDLPASMTAQRFYGLPPIMPSPRHPFLQPPASAIPSMQPKTEMPAPKPRL